MSNMSLESSPQKIPLGLEQPGAEPPEQMLSDDPPLRFHNMTEADKIASCSDSLAALATAASSVNPVISPVTAKKDNTSSGTSSLNAALQSDNTNQNDGEWHDVGIFKDSCALVTQYHLDGLDNQKNDFAVVPDLSKIRQDLEPGVTYKFRVAAVNACGRGPWSEVSLFRTCLPGYPGAPAAIKINKGIDCANISWEPPLTTSGQITEYSVYLAVRSATAKRQGDNKQTVTSNTAQLAFVRVYCGQEPSCTVTSKHLNSAHIDMVNKPAIIFRISARNEKGYGPATQVRWLQDGINVGNNTKPANKRTLQL